MRGALGVVVLAAAWCAAAAAAAPAPTVDAFGSWPLARLGSGPVAVGRSPADVPFAFPSGARQGPAAWFLGRLDATVRLERPAAGAVYLDASVGRWDWAQVQIRVVRGVTRWTSATAFGLSSGTARGLTARISVTNFLPVPSVVAGPAALSFRLVRYGALRAASATVGRRSGLEYSTAGPSRLVASVTAPRAGRVGDGGRAVVSLTNAGDRPVRAVGLEWTTSGRVAVAGRAAPIDLPAHRTVRVAYRLRFLQPGIATLYVAAFGAGGGATSSAVVRIKG